MLDDPNNYAVSDSVRRVLVLCVCQMPRYGCGLYEHPNWTPFDSKTGQPTRPAAKPDERPTNKQCGTIRWFRDRYGEGPNDLIDRPLSAPRRESSAKGK